MRLEFKTAEYKINKEKKTVVAIVFYRMRDNNICPMGIIKGIGIARAEKDTFNEEIGKKLARARAEREVFVQYNKILQKEYNKVQDNINKIQYAITKNKRNLEHQKEYIKTF